MIRAFVALPLPQEAIWRLEGAQAGLPSGRPVPPENFHITLAFLGEHPGPLIEDVHYALGQLRAPGFSVAIDGVGLFGGGRPTALYARVSPDPGLAHLREKVLQAARSAGIRLQSERFVPHVTLARFGNGLRGEEAEKMHAFVATRMGLSSPFWEIEDFVLYRSRLGKIASYEALATYPLETGQLRGAALSSGW
ncbi:MAG: RNA 2',3'-cyclic phosphodiesterase [Pseudomonadota bacterium]